MTRKHFTASAAAVASTFAAPAAFAAECVALRGAGTDATKRGW